MFAPEFSIEWYRAITEFAAGTPSWLRWLMELGTDGVLLFFGVMFLLGWWRARGRSAATMAVALLGPAATLTAYLASEVVKTFWQEDRPCRVLSNVVSIAECPSYGDWSFPSNHSVLAGAAATAMVLSRYRTAVLAVFVALLAAASRVFVGVHYPHDVLAGLLLGALVVTAVVCLLRAPMTSFVRRLRGHHKLWRLVAAGPVESDPATIRFRR
ncbi:phosphatase PAP2 family protein [Amycolatopsis nigrescens]|uniref:phosphatase PAP2 family protein n=1 Tax=Amycolatopsis nigrescens TaxID=381445 RepID=UPI00039F92BF|nr:phosphatase PAP2 family protein [Amycolatopsis nigrescens]